MSHCLVKISLALGVQLLLLCVVVRIASAAPANGQNFQDWSAQCAATEDESAARCYIFQNLVLTQNGQRLLHVAIGYSHGSTRPTAALTVPLGVSLKPGLKLQVEDGAITRIRYDRCDPNGCVGTLVLNGQLLYALKMRGKASVTFEDADGREVVVPVSLMGLTAGLESLQ